MNDTNGSNLKALIKSMFLLGGAQFVSILLATFRVKALALMLGPTGIGLYGLYSNLVEAAAKISSLGVGSSGIQYISNANHQSNHIPKVIALLALSLTIQGLVAAVTISILANKLSVWLVNGPEIQSDIRLVGIAVLFTLIATIFTTIYQGLRQVKYVGIITIISAALTTTVGLIIIYSIGTDGITYILILQPISTIAISIYFYNKLQVSFVIVSKLQETYLLWRDMIILGLAFMGGGLLSTGSVLIVRTLLTKEGGLEQAGYFAASWAISSTYVGLLLSSMTAEFYPKLTQIIKNMDVANVYINQQISLLVTIAGPLLLLMIGWAPLLILFLYSNDFNESIALLQWQSVGNILKLCSWPLTFSLAALGKSKSYFIIEFTFNLIFVGLIYILLPYLSLISVGIAFTVAHFAYFTIIYLTLRKTTGYRFQREIIYLIILLFLQSIIIFASANLHTYASMLISLAMAIIFFIYSSRLILSRISSDSKTLVRIKRFYRAIGLPL